MKVIQEVLPDSQVGLEIEIPAEMSQKTYDKVLQQMMRTINIPGFRKGKVPKPVFLQRIGIPQFKAAVLEELVQSAVDQAIKQEEIDAIGNYQLKSDFDALLSQYEPTQGLTLQISVDVPPRVTLKQYKDLTVQAEEILPDLEQVDKTLERYQSNLATLIPVEDRPSKMGDMAVIDFVGKVQDESGEWEAFEGGSAEDFQVELSEGRFIPGFIEGIAGMSLEETKDLEIPFPDDYSQPDLAGKPALFSITLKEIKEKELPELDDDFAQEVSEYETITELRASLEERYTKEATDRTQTNKNEALINALVEHLDAEIPNTLIQREVDFLLTQTIMQFSRQGIDVNKLLTREIVDNMRKQARPEAVDRLKRTLALGEVAKQEGISVDDDALEAKVEETMAEIEDVNQIDPERLVQVLKEELLQEKILTWLEGVNTVELVPEGSLKKADEEAAADADEPEDVAAENAVVDVDATAAE